MRGAIIAPMEGEYGDQEGHAGRSFGWPRPEGCVLKDGVFPQAAVQTCIVHLIRNSLDFLSWKDRKPVVDPRAC